MSEFQEGPVKKDNGKEFNSSKELGIVTIDEIKNLAIKSDYFDIYNFSLIDNDDSWTTLIPKKYTDSLDGNDRKVHIEERNNLAIDRNNNLIENDVKYNIPIVINKRVMYFINHFQTTMKASFSKWLSQSYKYIPMMREVLKDNNLPEDLVYIALIESGFNPAAYSRARACGPWQFIKSTGKRYGLRIDWWIDERRDPEKSTKAAARYLSDLYDMFSSWYLAGAAYNAGENKIRRAIDKHNTEDFWEMSEYRYLKKETKDYIPKLIAATIIAKNPHKYGFNDLELNAPLSYTQVAVSDTTDLKVIAMACNTNYRTVKMLNPELRRGCTPPNYPGYKVKIPQGKKEVFEKNFAKIRPSERYTFIRHVIKRGETLYGIARLYNTRIIPIMELNKIRNPRRIRSGRSLVIPVRSYRIVNKGINNKRKTSQVRNETYFNSNLKELSYIVKKGDTLWDIARRYEVRTFEIRFWNNLGISNTIYPGNILKLRIKSDLNT
ncbi:MAG: transglycosylase SLT domain-containing protein [Thermodesulfobacteriota bacterium]|nr:transglycosylase SLT domain-containing protein [Thermodesulfobacteriota bacterium]